MKRKGKKRWRREVRKEGSLGFGGGQERDLKGGKEHVSALGGGPETPPTPFS
jgi:hypothetical protein